MSSILVVVGSIVIYMIAYRFYGAFIAKKIFKANRENPVPSAQLRDDIDYIPTKKEVLFGHHFASIAGTGPIVGPAIAVIWGWVPALIWVIVGSIFAGAVHDYGALMISVRNRGVSVGDISGKLISRRVHMLFLFVILFALWIVVAIFGMVIAVIFKMYPQAVFPVWTQIPIAMAVGWLYYRKKYNIMFLSVIAVILMYTAIIIGVHFPLVMPSVLGFDPMSIWILILFIYAFIASVLPVWTLLQPRDYINSHQLIIGIALLVLGVILARPEFVAPAVQLAPKGAPPMIPFLFITVACGAVSGFHSLVSSGTSSKQLSCESEAKFIGFGGMLVEGFLAILVIVAVCAGLGKAGWEGYYSSWAAMQGLAAKVTAFVQGSANMLTSMGIPLKYGHAVIGVLIASFAGTTLDTATRIQRYIVTELAAACRVKVLEKRYPATALVVIAAMALAFSQGGGKGALILWPLFGTSNQLLAGLTLLVISTYLIGKRSRIWPMVIPMIFMIVISGWAMGISLDEFVSTSQWHLVVIGSFMLVLELWMIVEVVLKFKASARSSIG